MTSSTEDRRSIPTSTAPELPIRVVDRLAGASKLDVGIAHR